jgi:hypothetical protein
VARFQRNAKYNEWFPKLDDKCPESSTAETTKFEKSYPGGEKYSGQWLGNLRHGFGTLTLADQSEYEGNWEYGLAKGKGKYTYANGDEYDGMWANN